MSPVVEPLRAPFPAFGGKSAAAPLIWPRFGDVANYVEPFFNSGAVLLARPHAPRIETCNDLDCMIHARHRWLVDQTEFRTKMRTDPHYFDAKIAGWWVWGLCAWIGTGWCAKAARRRGRNLPRLARSTMSTKP